MKLILGDCLEEMPLLESGSIDLVLADVPYGTTACKWDTVIPLKPMWKQLKRLATGAVCIFGSEPFSSLLRISNLEEYKYDWIWEKDRPTNIFTMKLMPGKVHEIVSVFYSGIYNPQMKTREEGKGKTNTTRDLSKYKNNKTETTGKTRYNYSPDYNPSLKYPRDVLYFPRDSGKYHPTQKPVALMEYLIRTYTNKGDTVLDFTMGSGTTGVACVRTGRDFIGIENDTEFGYFKIAEKRIAAAQPALFT